MYSIVNEMEKLHGKVAVITGSASGMGAAMAKCFAAQGMKVAVSDIKDEKGKTVVKEILDNGGEAFYMHCDVRIENDVKAMVKETVKRYGKLHCMVNNAGITCASHPLHELTTADLEDIMGTNFNGVFFGMKYGIEAMLETKSNKENCTVINISSGCGFSSTAGLTFYNTSKHAVNAITKSAALEYPRHGITVNAINPGVFATSIFDGVPEEQMAIYREMCPNGRFGRPEEIAWLALFLSSDMARQINGSCISIDAGKMAGDFIPTNWKNPNIGK